MAEVVQPPEMIAQLEGARRARPWKRVDSTLPTILRRSLWRSYRRAGEDHRAGPCPLRLPRPAWFRRSVARQAAATPGERLHMIDGYDHNAPPEVIIPS
jgi:hypothetical protein